MSKSFHIPYLGEVITLAEPWEFSIYDEHRNATLIQFLDPGRSDEEVRYWHVRWPVYRIHIPRWHRTHGGSKE